MYELSKKFYGDEPRCVHAVTDHMPTNTDQFVLGEVDVAACRETEPSSASRIPTQQHAQDTGASDRWSDVGVTRC